MVDGRIAAYLRANGYTILPQREFSQRWNNATLIYGDPVDPTTGRINTKTFIQIVQAVRDDMREKTDVEGFVFTDLIEPWAGRTEGMTMKALEACAAGPMWEVYEPTPLTRKYLVNEGFIK